MLLLAFQINAFQNDAFQIGEEVAVDAPVRRKGGRYRDFHVDPRSTFTKPLSDAEIERRVAAIVANVKPAPPPVMAPDFAALAKRPPVLALVPKATEPIVTQLVASDLLLPGLVMGRPQLVHDDDDEILELLLLVA